jgi:hypothetical protein
MRSFKFRGAIAALALSVAAGVFAPGVVLAGGHPVVPCAFPDGWNPTDYRRQVLHIPPDQHHFCQVDSRGQVVDSHGRRTN